jgi:hypothetical protein
MALWENVAKFFRESGVLHIAIKAHHTVIVFCNLNLKFFGRQFRPNPKGEDRTVICQKSTKAVP